MPLDQFADRQHNLGVALSKQQRHAEAEQAYRESLRLRPDFGPTLAALADALRCQGRVGEALTTYHRALERSPELFATHSNYGLLLAQRGELEQGLKHCRQAVALKPDSAAAHHQLGKVLLEYGHIKEAMDALAKARRLGNDSADLCISVGKGWLQLADYHEAKLWFERALKMAPDLVEARCQLGTVHLQAGDPEGASRIFQQVLEKSPQSVEAHVGLARARLEQGDVEGAVASHHQAIHICPEWSVLHAALGQTLSSAGDLDGALSCNRQALALNPHCVPALSGLLTTLRGKATDGDMHASEHLLQASWMTDGRRAQLHFGLAQALDGRGDWGRAAEHMAAANVFQKKQNEKRGQAYAPANHRRFIDLLIASFTSDFFARTQGFGSDSERPVFIIGMPRSGTTLVEQVLASHPRVHGAGERRFAKLSFQLLPVLLEEKKKPIECLAQLQRNHSQRLADWHLKQLHELDQGRAARVTDKMPENYQLLGWIAMLFPRARFIHCLRDVRDVALSCWLTNFTQVLWANDLEHIADRINEYLRISDHWRRVLPVALLEVAYEQLVANPEETSRRLLDFAGLEWDPACLSFHKTERLVRTASVAQVRQPIYQSSVGRWKHYEAALRPLLERLQNQVGQAQKEEVRGLATAADGCRLADADPVIVKATRTPPTPPS